MEIGLKESLIIYAERFDEGHPLKDIAITTLHELGKQNPFGRAKIQDRKPYTKSHTPISEAYYSLTDNQRQHVRLLFKKYGYEI